MTDLTWKQLSLFTDEELGIESKTALTHEEVLALINNKDLYWFHHLNALRAVVELHKPYKYEGLDIHDEPITSFHCMQCGRPYLYPCETIKAIEKELR